MLEYFFAKEVAGEPTQELFTGLKINDYPNYMAYQGKYPVIFISFKDIKAKDFPSCMAQIAELIRATYNAHIQISKSPKLTEYDLRYINEIFNLDTNPNHLQDSLQNLTRLLYEHYQERPILLIDEYDAPLHHAYVHKYYEDLIDFLRNLFSAALKDNKSLHKAILTGILRVSKKNLFSDLNHISIYSSLDKKYAEYFGFTEEETTKLLEDASLQYNLQEIKSWYNGYNFGGLTIYNPWSILQCIDEQGSLKPYWVNTSGNELLKQLIINDHSDIRTDITKLIQGESIKVLVDEHVVFADLDSQPSCIWGLLLLSGYLKYLSAKIQGRRYLCSLVIPNKEIEDVYVSLIEDWLNDKCGHNWQPEYLKALLAGDIPTLEEKLQTFVLEALSYHDVSRKSADSRSRFSPDKYG